MKNEILKLDHKEFYVVPEGDYGKAEIWKIYDVYLLFEIPRYGGEPMYVESYRKNEIDLLISDIEKWT